MRYNNAVPILQVSHLSKTFDGKLVLDDVSFGLDASEIVCLLGPSGCGKTTLLRIIAGLETTDSGTIICDGRDVQTLPVHQRNFGLMFQDFALFPHKSVWDNVIFGLRMQNLPADQVQQLGQAALDLVGLNGFEKPRPDLGCQFGVADFGLALFGVALLVAVVDPGKQVPIRVTCKAVIC